MAAELIVEEGPLRGLIFSFENGEEWTIGRDPDYCNLIVEDPKASRRHLLCRRTIDGYEVENLSETNPVLINEQPITEPTVLRDQDRLKLGSNEFRFYLFGHQGLVEHAEGDFNYETIYREEDVEQQPKVHFDVTPARYYLKVISGPNSGSEIGLENDKNYVIGTDTASCDIVFHDLSISRQHALISVDSDGFVTIEDRGSRNGVIVDRQRIDRRVSLKPNSIVSLGTTTFFIVDREAPRETIVAPIIEPVRESKKEPVYEESTFKEAVVTSTGAVSEQTKRGPLIGPAMIIPIILIGLAALIGIGMLSLFKSSKEISAPHRDYNQEISKVISNFPGVKYTFNRNTGRLFLLGHVSSTIQKNELQYNLQGLDFITGMDDNVVVDEYVWQEMNILIAKNPEWRGVSMQAPEPGRFVITGYLKTNKEAAALNDYINLNFNYLDLLENKVVVEEQLVSDVTSRLLQSGFGGVTPSVSSGELTLTGYISSMQNAEYQNLVQEFHRIYGIRAVRNYVISLSPEQAIMDLSNRYKVTGYSKYGDININVVIDGRILTRGDRLDGMTIMSIQPHTIFLEKDGLKYKIEYNS